MAVFRVEKNANYTTMCNYHLRDKKLSLKAKGLLSLFLSLPDEWHYSIRGIAAISREGVDSINTALQELEKNGYLIRSQKRQENGRMGEIEYVIYEMPEGTLLNGALPEGALPDTGSPYTENPDTGLSDTENPREIKKDRTSTERTNTEINKKRERKHPVRHRYGQYRNVLLTDEEVEKLKNEFPNDYQSRIERLSEYMASTGRIYKNHLATIRSWARRDEQKAHEKKTYDHGKYQFAAGESL
ncbi:MAG: helix-turn-helix domain-containing protein [Bilifractor sp.]|nr:helix-turn-helix domain-containing protein [Lachnospiraceae bacterium]MDY2836529.1 helix-turn-helix domain-containing protein [Bilifractor sp.]